MKINGRDSLTFFLSSIVEFGNYFVFTSNDLIGYRGIFLYDKQKKSICDSSSSLVIAALAKDPNERIWLSLTSQICQLDTNELKNGKLRIVPAVSAGLNFGSGYFAFDRKSTWIVRNGEEIIRIGDDGSLLRVPGTNTQSLGGFGNIFIDRENILWFTNAGAGVGKLVNTNLLIRSNLPGEIRPGLVHIISYIPDTTWYALRNKSLLRKTGNSFANFKINIKEEIVFVAQRFGKLFVGTNKKLYASAVPLLDKGSIELTSIHTLSPDDNMGHVPCMTIMATCSLIRKAVC